MSAGWAPVPGATGYVVQLDGHLVHRVHRLAPTALATRFVRLRDGLPVTVRVLALRGTATAASAALTATPQAGAPVPVTGVTAVTAHGQHLRVTWTGGGRMRYVAVAAGSDSRTGADRFTTHWLRPVTRSVLLTIPVGLRDRIGRGTGQPVFVKLLQTNTPVGSPPKPVDASAAARYTVSAPGVWAIAGATAPKASAARITVGEWNMQSIASTAHYATAHQWAARVAAVAAEVESAHPALLATAELSTSQVSAPLCVNHPSTDTWCTADTQYMDLAHHLAAGPHPYALATDDAYPKVIAEMHAGDGAWNGAVTDGAHLFYDPAVLTLDDHGYLSPVFDLKVANWTPARGDRWLSWARFTIVSTGQQFVAAAAHFPVGADAATIAIRADEAQRASAALQSIAGPLPIVLAGDLNGDRVRTPDAAATVFSSLGWFDAAATTHRTGIRYSTDNATNGHDDGGDIGYPAHVTPHPYPTSRIDYVLVKGTTRSYAYANVVRTIPGSTALDPAYQGSDHDLQLATIGFR